MELPAQAYAAIGAIAAAAIAGGISFLMAVLSKDQKTSEFRQAWIDGLRNEMADLVSHFIVVTDIYRILARQGMTREQIAKQFIEDNDEHFCKIEIADAKIKLRLNPKEHKTLLLEVAALREYAASEKLADGEAASALVGRIMIESQKVLKKEWKRVKRGEPVFIATKLVSLLIIISAVTVGALYASHHLGIEFYP